MNFDDLAEKFLNKTILQNGNRKYRICEIEFYLYSSEHKDQYTHCYEEQLGTNGWYFHKHGKSYKEGTYKGLDITLGDGKNTYLGILIRSIMSDKGNLIEGPCRCVNELIFPCVKVSEFMRDFPFQISCYRNSKKIELVPEKLQREKIYQGKRIGLSDKYPEWRIKKYRYLIYKNLIRKSKGDLVEVKTENLC